MTDSQNYTQPHTARQFLCLQQNSFWNIRHLFIWSISRHFDQGPRCLQNTRNRMNAIFIHHKNLRVSKQNSKAYGSIVLRKTGYWHNLRIEVNSWATTPSGSTFFGFFFFLASLHSPSSSEDQFSFLMYVLTNSSLRHISDLRCGPITLLRLWIYLR